MMQYFFQILFTFMLHIIIHLNYGASRENRPTQMLHFRKEKCESLLNNCSCDYYRTKINIQCNEVTDFSNFSRIHEFGDIFHENETFYIKFRNIKHLPARTFWGLKINNIELRFQDVTVDEDVFQGIRYLRELQAAATNIKVVPDFRTVANSIQIIRIDSSSLTSLEGKNLQNLTDLWRLSFRNNSIRFIDPDVFKGTENVETIDLSHNLLTSIPPKLLNKMRNLVSIDISNNNLQHVNDLFSVTCPERIDLGFNNITDADSILHFKTNKEMDFTLSGNPIKKLPGEGFFRKMPDVKELYLAHCRLEEFDAEQFLSVYHLRYLDLSYNLIEDLRKSSSSLSPANLTVEYLYLSGNKLQNLHNHLRIRKIVDMRFDRNELKYLTDEDFKHVDPTSTLKLERNKIHRIDTNTFQYSKQRLNYLDLSCNLIQSLNGSVKYLSNLEKLNLSYNSIQTFAKDEFMGIDELSYIDLQYNQIKALVHLPVLYRLSINHNNIETMTPDHIPKEIRKLHLADNPWKCDCRLQPFMLQWINATLQNFVLTDIKLCLRSDFVNTLRCPGLCSCNCTHIGEFSFMSVDCSSKNLSIELLKYSFMEMDNSSVISDNQRLFVMEQNIHPLLHIEDRVLGINLENNNLTSLDGIELHPDLLHLYLANNKLRRLPEFIFDNLQNLKQVSLSGNPWECDCNTKQFRKWLISNYAVIQDMNDTRCGRSDKGESNLDGKVISTLSDIELCPPIDMLILSTSIGILTFLTLCFSAKFLYSKYQLNLKVFLYFHGFTFVKEKDLDHDKRFDAFLSFSHVDGNFVANEIIPQLENKAPNVRLFIHYRDFLAGEFIHNNIMYAVENSKKTIIFLSRSFLESDWCLMEFQAAHEQTLKDKVQRIILIKLGDLPKKIDHRIKVYLESTTYLTWGEQYFWKKLLFILPTSNGEGNPVSKNARVAEILRNTSFPDLSNYIVESSH